MQEEMNEMVNSGKGDSVQSTYLKECNFVLNWEGSLGDNEFVGFVCFFLAWLNRKRII